MFLVGWIMFPDIAFWIYLQFWAYYWNIIWLKVRSKVWNHFHPVVYADRVSIFQLAHGDSTWGHAFKLAVHRCLSEVKRKFLSVRFVRVWNALPVRMVCCGSLVLLRVHWKASWVRSCMPLCDGVVVLHCHLFDCMFWLLFHVLFFEKYLNRLLAWTTTTHRSTEITVVTHSPWKPFGQFPATSIDPSSIGKWFLPTHHILCQCATESSNHWALQKL
jgi:hypothetical protein